MSFPPDISELAHNINFKFSQGDRISFQTPQDVFFRSKQDEIIEQYQAAQSFLINAAEGKNYIEWFFGSNDNENFIGNEKTTEGFKLKYQATMFESALIYYNIIIDLSWVLCYSSAEFALHQSDKPVIGISEVMNIEKACEIYRKLESKVTDPYHQEELEYLSTICRDFSPAIDKIMDFWNQVNNTKVFSDGSTIRSLYNFIKHRGKPLYNEIDKLEGSKLMGLYIGENKCPSDIRDLQKRVDLYDSIQKLELFDEKVLFPYIKGLLHLLEKSLKPSKFV